MHNQLHMEITRESIDRMAKEGSFALGSFIGNSYPYELVFDLTLTTRMIGEGEHTQIYLDLSSGDVLNISSTHLVHISSRRILIRHKVPHLPQYVLYLQPLR